MHTDKTSTDVKWNGNTNSRHSAGSAAAASHAARIWNDGSVTSTQQVSRAFTAVDRHAWHCNQHLVLLTHYTVQLTAGSRTQRIKCVHTGEPVLCLSHKCYEWGLRVPYNV